MELSKPEHLDEYVEQVIKRVEKNRTNPKLKQKNTLPDENVIHKTGDDEDANQSRQPL